MPEHILIFLWFVGIVVHKAFASVWVEFARRMPGGDILLGRCIAVPFLCMQVQQLRPFHILHLTEDTYQLFYVVTVEGTEVTDVHAFKNVLLMRDGAFHGIRQTDETFATVLTEHTSAVQPARSLKTNGIIGLICAETNQILFHTAHRAIDRHVVIVEDDQQVIGRG